jgi:hypothetical protein
MAPAIQGDLKQLGLTVLHPTRSEIGSVVIELHGRVG